MEPRRGLKNGAEQRTLAASHVDQPLEAREVVGREQVVRPIVAQSDGGVPVPGGYQHVAGETLFFSCRISGYAKTPEEKVHVTYSVQPFDPKGVPLTDIY